MTCWTVIMNLTLNKAIRGLFTRQSAYDGVPSNWVWLQRGNQCWRHSKRIIWPHTVTLTLKIAKHFFFTRHWLIMMHFHTMFGYKMLYRSEDIIRVNSQWHFEPLLWPWPSPWTQQTTHSMTLCDCGSWWCITVPSSVTKVSAVQKVPSGQTLNCILNHYCDLDLLHNKNTFSKSVLAYDGLPTI